MTRIETILTGRTRHRRSLFGRMVLEVEEQHRRISTCPPRPGSDPGEWNAYLDRTAGRPWTTWRDATYPDVHELQWRAVAQPSHWFPSPAIKNDQP